MVSLELIELSRINKVSLVPVSFCRKHSTVLYYSFLVIISLNVRSLATKVVLKSFQKWGTFAAVDTQWTMFGIEH